MRYVVGVAREMDLEKVKEDVLSKLLTVDVWWPSVKVKIKVKRAHNKIIEKDKPIYGRYFFIGLEAESKWKLVYGCRTVVGVLKSVDLEPFWIVQEVIDSLRAEKWEGLSEGVSGRFKKGDVVRIAKGAFEGCLGHYVKPGVVNLKLFARDNLVRLPDSYLVLA